MGVWNGITTMEKSVSNFFKKVYAELLYCFRKARSQCMRLVQKVGGAVRSKRMKKTDLALYRVQFTGVIYT